MQKKSLWFILSAVLAVLLIFTGCPTGSSTDSDSDSSTPDASVPGGGGGGGGSPAPDTGKEGLNGTYTVLSGQIYTVGTGGTYTVGSAGVFTVKADGTLVIQTGAVFVVQKGGKLTVEKTDGISNSGALTVAKGATVTIGGKTLAEGKTYAGGVEESDDVTASVVEAFGGGDKVTVSDDGSTFTLNEEVTKIEKAAAVPPGIELVIPEGKELEVSNTTLTVEGTVSVSKGATIKAPGLNDDGTPKEDSQIAFEAGGKIELATGATGYYGETLFIGSSTDTGAIYQWVDNDPATITLKGENVTELTSGTVIVNQSTGVAKDTTTIIAEDAKLVLNKEVEYTVVGTLDVEGTVTVPSGGTIKAPALKEDGTPDKDALIDIGENGGVVLSYGATGYYGETLFISSSGDNVPYIWDTGSTTAVVTLKSGYVTELTSGKVTVNADTGIAAGTTVHIATGATLTIASEKTYMVAGTLSGDPGAQIVKTGTITIAGGTKNFYPSDNTTAEDTPGGSSYTWAATAGGSGKSGWKAAAAAGS
jgi:hypothetical protein